MESEFVFQDVTFEGSPITPEEFAAKVQELRELLGDYRQHPAISETTIAKLIELATQEPTEN